LIFDFSLENTGENKYKIAADIFRAQLDSHPRTAQGQFWHKLKYPNQGASVLLEEVWFFFFDDDRLA
jgi:rhamnogalacturonyl hydrolase YesR